MIIQVDKERLVSVIPALLRHIGCPGTKENIPIDCGHVENFGGSTCKHCWLNYFKNCEEERKYLYSRLLDKFTRKD